MAGRDRLMAKLITSAMAPRAGLIFPGGGLFFWWQAGTIIGLSNHRVALSRTPSVGASAGALAATLGACEVDMEVALDCALDLTRQAGCFDRGPWGLYGVWGGLVRSWLHTLLPDDAHERCSGQVSVLVKQPSSGYPWLKQLAVSDFECRDDLIDCCMASVHIPLFLDAKLTAPFQGERCVDGSIDLLGQAKVRYEMPGPFTHLPTLKVAPFKDRKMREAFGRTQDFLRLPAGNPEASVRQMMLWGRQYVDLLNDEGQLELLRDP